MEADKIEALIERIDKERGFSRPWRNMLASRDPELMRLNHATTMHILHREGALPRKIKEIIVACLDAYTYHEPGFRAHVRNALKAGATEQEILEALECCTLIGVHPLTEALPALIDEVEKCHKEAK